MVLVLVLVGGRSPGSSAMRGWWKSVVAVLLEVGWERLFGGRRGASER